MTMYTWNYGSVSVGLAFTVKYDDVAKTFTVNVTTGSMDLNALWFSNENNTVNGTTSLSGSDNSLNMNGTSAVWDGTSSTQIQIVWDEYLKISSTGLGTSGTDKPTYLTAGESYVYNFS